MIAYKIHAAIFDALWAVFWRVGTPNPIAPDFAWTNTRSRMQKISDWFQRHHPDNC